MKLGILIRFWRWVFGEPVALPTEKPVSQEVQAPKQPQCASPANFIGLSRCAGQIDPRCKAGNCTSHCREHCRGLCLGGETNARRRAKCAVYCCSNLADPRCEAGNCTMHCSSYCPQHRCCKREVIQKNITTLRDTADIFRAAPVPSVVSIVTCSCGIKNRVPNKDFGRGPICGKCKKALRLPS